MTTADQTSTTTHTPDWAIVRVILFIWFLLLRLLFIAREIRTSELHGCPYPGGYSYIEQVQVPIHFAVRRKDVLNRVLNIQRRSRGG
ncbi:hypothetical protein ABH924_004886 [Arthrobacter sp. GAS37]|uniref:hypothetical protein n=1 Tax=Arthrobacter sp. GAS37 TaxID=3156261 RepID=UPI0038390B55